MNNIDVSQAINLLQQFGIDLDKLEPKKLERIIQITQQINDPSQITPEFISEITSILKLNTQKNNQNVLNQNGKNIKTKIKIKIGRNEPCPCESGKKWKNCCM
jgi:uncharacterized protein YecA (UPF0149 family)